MGERFVIIDKIAEDGRIALRRGIHRTLWNKPETVVEHQAAYIKVPKDEPVVFGKVYDVTQFQDVVGQAVCEEGPDQKPSWKVKTIFGLEPTPAQAR